MSKTGVIITRDIFFASKVTGTASALGLSVRSASSPDQIKDAALQGNLGLVILDLDCPGISPSDVIAVLPASANITTVAFGPHVHEDQLAAARDAGFLHVMPRSKFSAGLVEILRTALSID